WWWCRLRPRGEQRQTLRGFLSVMGCAVEGRLVTWATPRRPPTSPIRGTRSARHEVGALDVEQLGGAVRVGLVRVGEDGAADRVPGEVRLRVRKVAVDLHVGAHVGRDEAARLGALTD